MVKVRAIFDGEHVILLEPMSLPPNTEVEVIIPETAGGSEDLYWQRLRALGLVSGRPVPTVDAEPFTPVAVSGPPVSQTIVDERR